jgi:hypothetical protein
MPDEPKELEIPSRRPCVTRRALMGVATGIALATVSGRLASAQERDAHSSKSSKTMAGYIEKDGPSAQSCTTCHWFYDPDECVLVVSPVSPWGYCNYYED